MRANSNVGVIDEFRGGGGGGAIARPSTSGKYNNSIQRSQIQTARQIQQHHTTFANTDSTEQFYIGMKTIEEDAGQEDERTT